MTQQERLEVEIELLQRLRHVPAWTGTLGDLRQKSYVPYEDVISLLNDNKRRLLDITQRQKFKSDETRSNG